MFYVSNMRYLTNKFNIRDLITVINVCYLLYSVCINVDIRSVSCLPSYHIDLDSLLLIKGSPQRASS